MESTRNHPQFDRDFSIATVCHEANKARVRWHVKLRQGGATLRASGAIAYNVVANTCPLKGL